jgi:NitT/TauT family transport system substrate-binding protein
MRRENCRGNAKSGDKQMIFRAAIKTVIAAMLVVTAVGSASAQTVPARFLGDGGVLKMPTNPAGTSGWIAATIQKNQLEKKYNFRLEIVPVANTPMIVNALQSGSGDIGVFQFLDIMKMRKAGIPVVGVGPFLAWGANHVLVPKNSPHKTIGDLKGKKLGIFHRTDVDWILIQGLAKSLYKLNPEKDITIHEGAAPLLGGLVQTGQLDAVTMYNNLTPALVATGNVKVLAWIRDLLTEAKLPQMPFLFYGVREAYLKSHPQNIRAYLAAYREAVEILRHNDEIWRERGKELQMLPETIVLLRDEMRVDLETTFKPTLEADLQTAFAFLLKEAGAEALGGFTSLPPEWMTRDYQ